MELLVSFCMNKYCCLESLECFKTLKYCDTVFHHAPLGDTNELPSVGITGVVLRVGGEASCFQQVSLTALPDVQRGR